MPVSAVRIRELRAAPVRPERSFVLYWMTSARRLRWNHALDRALEHARALGLPLLVFEALRASYPWASERFHAFVIDGMHDNAAEAEAAGVTYLPYVERQADEGKGLLAALAADAAVVVTDDFPTYFLPNMLSAAVPAIDVRFEAVDSNGVLPLAQPGRTFTMAQHFRRHLHKHVVPWLLDRPSAAPLEGYALGRAHLPAAVTSRWPVGVPSATGLGLGGPRTCALRGGAASARARLAAFLRGPLARYAEDRNEPDVQASTGLSPALHFGHIAAHEVVAAVLDGEGWTPARIEPTQLASREGFWGLSAPAEAFIDEIVTWRELAYNDAWERPQAHRRYDGLPSFALQTLDKHRGDRRPVVYDAATLEAARTHDPLWNAAQRQLLREGVIHNYLRMLWGKKVLEWSASPEEAFDTLVDLNNRYALDGRNPNSWSGIAWCFGRFDRAWGPERPIFGTVRYMSSDNTARKIDVKGYLRRYSA
jgi:deoxyribodipyrimidine photo-lyase